MMTNERLLRFRGRRSPITDAYEVSLHITALAAHGHEVGHTAYEVTNSGETLLIWGDIVHVPSIQFARPELTWELDANQDQGTSDATQTASQCCASEFPCLAGAHLEFPGVGTVREQRRVIFIHAF